MLSIANKEMYTIENKLREIRARLRLTQENLASGVGVSRQTILFIESGKYVPSLQLSLLIAAYLKLNINEIFTLKKKGKI